MSGKEEVWVPVTVHLPLGFAKSWSPNKCAPVSLICGPYAIIMLAQLGNTVLVPVLPFLVKQYVSPSHVAKQYGILQSAMWIAQTLLSPMLGALSDSIGRRQVIFVSLLISMGGCVLLGYSTTFIEMLASRIITGAGFQIALFRAYFADTQPKEKRTGSFGLIGVIQVRRPRRARALLRHLDRIKLPPLLAPSPPGTSLTTTCSGSSLQLATPPSPRARRSSSGRRSAGW